jgi:ribosomal-protein-alanine N-acetyltransferase
MDLDALFDDFPTLETTRLTLRPLIPEDYDDAATFFSDPDVGQHTTWLGMIERQGLAGFLSWSERATAERELAIWGIAERSAGKVIGFVSLYPLVLEHGRAELGYALARLYWGRGYAPEAARAVVDCAFVRLACHRVEAFSSVENTASTRVLESLGFRREGVLREHTVIRGAPRNRAIYALLRTEWEEQQR